MIPRIQVTEPLKIAQILGVHPALELGAMSMHELAETVSLGLPKQALRRTAQRVYTEPREVNELMYKLVPEATFKRRTRLTPAESERTERLARVIAAAEQVWGNQEDAREWLRRSHPELGDQAPIQRAMSELGAREVEELLDRMFYGLPS
jgi:putative toxin-antitoxin system antitoxin component (TIGR02293 family)